MAMMSGGIGFAGTRAPKRKSSGSRALPEVARLVKTRRGEVVIP
jgi:hypothetical protein